MECKECIDFHDELDCADRQYSIESIYDLIDEEIFDDVNAMKEVLFEIKEICFEFIE